MFDPFVTNVELFPIESVLHRRLLVPLTPEDMRTFFRYRHLPTNDLDFIDEATLYYHLYHDWKNSRRKKKSYESLTVYRDDNEDFAGVGDSQVQKSSSAKSKKKSRARSQSARYQKDLKRQAAASQFQAAQAAAIANETSTAVDNTIPLVSILRRNASADALESLASSRDKLVMSNTRPSNAHIQTCPLSSSPSLSNLGIAAGSGDNMMRTGGSSIISISSSKLSKNRISSNKVSAAAVHLLQTYMMPDASKPLSEVAKVIVESIAQHYEKAMTMANHTGLRFIPSPDRAFTPVVNGIKSHMITSGLYSRFLRFACSNTVPSSKTPPYEYQSISLFYSYMQGLAAVSIAGFIVIAKIYSGASRGITLLLILPSFLLFLTIGLAIFDVSPWLWLRKTREHLILAPVDSVNSNADIERGSEIYASLKVKVVPVSEPQVLRALNLIVVRMCATAMVGGIIISCVCLLFWDDYSQ